MNYPYIVIDAAGGLVYSAHTTLESARRRARRLQWTDERGQRIAEMVVAHNPDNRYRKGDTFWRDRPPTPVA